MVDSFTQRAVEAVRAVVPESIERLVTSRRDRKLLTQITPQATGHRPPAQRRVAEAIRFLGSRGLSERMVRSASMPEASLDYVAEVVTDRLPDHRPIRALHVGNFVGVSLSYLTCLVVDRHADSVMVSVEPNIAHRWIGDAQGHVFALLHHFGLLSNSLVIPGYTLQRTPEMSTGALDANYPIAGENVLASLARVCGQPFDLVLLDGNHEEDHLASEFDALRMLLDAHSVVVFDDVGTAGWPGVGEVFSRALGERSFLELGHDGRVGILQVQTGPVAVQAGGR